MKNGKWKKQLENEKLKNGNNWKNETMKHGTWKHWKHGNMEKIETRKKIENNEKYQKMQT